VLSTPAAAPRTTPVSIQQIKDSWPEILDVVEKLKRTAWMVVFTAKPLELRDKTLVLSFPSERDVDALKQRSAPGEGVGDYLKKAFLHVLGFEPALSAKVEGTAAAPPAAAPQSSPDDSASAPEPSHSQEPAQQSSAPQMPAPQNSAAQPRSSQSVPPAADEGPEPEEPAPAEDREPGGWAVAAIPESEPEPDVDPSMSRSGAAAASSAAKQEQTAAQHKKAKQPSAPASTPVAASAPPAEAARPSLSAAAAQIDRSRYGESVVRELLNATFIEEQQVAPRVTPQPRDE
jgi:DNA polymerase-3 subunit gamma/tau